MTDPVRVDRSGDPIAGAWQYGVMFSDGSVSRRWNGRTQEQLARQEWEKLRALYSRDDIRLVRRWIGPWEAAPARTTSPT